MRCKDEHYLATVAEFEEKISELRLKNSSIFEATETPSLQLWKYNKKKARMSLGFQGFTVYALRIY